MPKTEVKTTLVSYSEPALQGKVSVEYRDTGESNPTGDAVTLIVGEYNERVEVNNHQLQVLAEMLTTVVADIVEKKVGR